MDSLLPPIEKLQALLETRQAEDSLAAFIRSAWPTLEPGVEYIHGWHIDAICEHLEAMLAGQIRNLIINIPPRHMKSLAVAVSFPVWAWIAHPHLKFLFSSYAQNLAIRDTLKSRRLIQSPWFQDRWGDRFKLAFDQNTKSRYDNDKGGGRIATSVGGTVTGEGGDFVVCDDPHNIRKTASPVDRETTVTWWDEVMSTRLNNPKTGRKLVIMQRVHEQDLTGHLIECGGYEHLCLPVEYEGKTCITSLGSVDKRTKQGELLYPERFGAEEVERLKRSMGAYAVAAQLQQNPVPRGGGLFKKDWFEIVKDYPRGGRMVRYWDRAGTAAAAGKDPDWTVGCLMTMVGGVYYVVDIVRFQGTPADNERVIRSTAITDGQSVIIWMEQEPGSSGKDTMDNYQRRVLPEFALRADRKTGSKLEAAQAPAAKAEAGNVKLVQAAWNREFLEEIAVFDKGRHDDQVDAFSGAFRSMHHGVVETAFA